MLRAKTNPWSRLEDFVYAHKRLSVALSIGMVLIAASIITAAVIFQPKRAQPIAATQPEQQAPTPAPPKFYSPLTGVEVADEATTKRQVTGIMLENSPSSRPQSGLKDAGIVYEAIAEGGITRYAALYQESRPQLIGPVRSLRPYYLDWMAPYDAAIAHVGGSFNALQTVRNGTFKDIDQFFNGSYYWRSTDRVAPHNVYTSFDRLDALNQKKGFTSSTFTPLARKTDQIPETPAVNIIHIPVSSATYNVRYEYDKATNTYTRFLGGAPHTDREAGQIKPKTVIAMKVPTQLGFEDGYREQMTTNGHGTAYVFQDGSVVEGIWRKDGQKNQITFYDKNAHIIALNPGQTWITVVAPEKSITWQ